jgi:hypothetical protein
MPDTLQKLRPDRDLQCYFEQPSAVAALSGTAPDKFTVSGTWRQQFDWAVIEWARDNVYEHPYFRSLPDGDLSGLTLTYDETRTNCIRMDSDLFHTVDWPFLRVWSEDAAGVQSFHKIPLHRPTGSYATPIEGSYSPASATFELQGTITAGDYIGLSWLSEHQTYQVYAVDTLSTVLDALVLSINTFSPYMHATKIGNAIQISYVLGQSPETSTTGANGNRVGVYSYTSSGATLSWVQPWAQLSGGTSPTKWRVSLNFSSLTDENGASVSMTNVRKMRWTYAADLQSGAFQRSEFAANISNWTVTGTNRAYRVAGPGSRRIENDSPLIQYTGAWAVSTPQNFSGGTIRSSTAAGASAACTYQSPQSHELYLGTRFASVCSGVTVQVDGVNVLTRTLNIADVDALVRIRLGTFPPGQHQVQITRQGTAGQYLYFDFLELAITTDQLPIMPPQQRVTLATDWDTDHSLALAPERTAWMIQSLGFHGRVNHYVGAMWFYELVPTGQQYASGTITFSGAPQPNLITEIRIGNVDEPGIETVLQHLNIIGDTAETIARAYQLQLNNGYTAVRASVTANVLTIYSRVMGEKGNQLTLAATPATGTFTAVCTPFTGGTAGRIQDWHTDLISTPRLNRAVRDWSRSFYTALHQYGLDVTAAFSMELRHGDDSLAAGIAQRYPGGDAVLLNTPALQTNFAPVTVNFFKGIYLEMAQVLQASGLQPFLQFGEVQWWYFPDLTGLPFYDAYTKSRFTAAYGRDMATILNSNALPSQFPDEAAFLPTLIGEFTDQIMSYVRATIPTCRFEVLYPVDVNDTPFNTAENFPAAHWTPAALDCLKTESFTYTYSRNLDLCTKSIAFAVPFGFPVHRRSHLVGIGDPVSPWIKEVNLSQSSGAESIVLFALDQFCLIGYSIPIDTGGRRSLFQG